MGQSSTESMLASASGLDALPDEDILGRLHQAQVDAVATVRKALPNLAAGARCMSHSLVSGSSLVYAGAGSSALMASADAMELSGTFGIDINQVRILMAGGLPKDASMPGNTEDDTEEAINASRVITAGDTVIAVTASGSTPYTVEIARIARQRGASTICIANNRDARIFDYATVAICLPSAGEVIGGSTRMGAGSAQKTALNIMSTLMGIQLGHVYDGMMVNLHADNEKLRARALGMVCRITDIPSEQALTCLETAGGQVKPAVLLAAGIESMPEANALLEKSKGHLRAALDFMRR